MDTTESNLSEGLSTQTAAQRLQRDGYNELPSARPQNIWMIVWKVISEPMLLLLIACGGIYLLLGDTREALVLLGFVFVIIGITFFQEHKTERALEALRDLSSPRALALRDGAQRRIAGREVVRGDIILLAEGDRVPADAILLSCLNMTVDESLLTGESVPVTKMLAESMPAEMGQPGGEHLPFVFSGSLIVQGKGLALVMATGVHTAIGQIGKALFAVKEEPTRVQREMHRVVKFVAVAAIALAVFLAIWFGITRQDWLSGALVGITFAMAVIPEELPVVLMLFLGIGAWRIAQKQVLTRRVPAIEMLGATTVLCVDKTGTLTQNRMEIAQLYADGAVFVCDGKPLNALPEEFHEVLEYAILSSHRDPFDPMEVAIQDAGKSSLHHTEHLHDSWGLVNEYPLSRELLAMSRVWASADRSNYVIAAKGAPEAIADLCHLPAERIAALTAQVDQMASQGLRVLGVAKAVFSPRHAATPATANAQDLPEIQHDFDFELLGLVALADPVRPGVPAAISECQSAGIRVVMITGDYPATASQIAGQCGLSSPGGMMTGADLDQISDAALPARISDVSIFCRVRPEQKLRLVNALKQAGDIVAMTGDGVNDAPALKAAHIGIAMGQRGTDVARESASMVLLNDDFFSIVAAIRLGRRIFDNLRKTVAYIVAVHVPVVGLSVVPVMMGWPVVLMPVHILVLQLIIDPTCSLVFEAESEEGDVMQRPPRRTDATIFERNIVWKGCLQGCVLLATALATFGIALHQGVADGPARAMAFTCMVLGNVGLILLNRSLSPDLLLSIRLPNPMLWWMVAGALTMLAVSLSVPAISALFYFDHPTLTQIGISASMALLCLCVLAAAKTRAFFQPDAA
ncbi:MAG: cation-translocating P-type ATPase [Burkholderiales bacterium]|nr:cation-translocating P-type ATPase [Burkholderiales bacterium]